MPNVSEASDDLRAGLPIRDFLLYVVSNRTLLEVVHRTAGFSLHIASVMRSQPIPGDDPGDFEKSSVGQMSADAQKEVDNGFPLLHGHTLIGLWGALEACIEDMSLLWLRCVDRPVLADYLAGTRVKLGEYLGLAEDDQWRWILSQIEKLDTGALRTGVGQFEGTLNAIGLGGAVDSNVRTVLFRAKAVRNLYAHKAGRADAKFLKEWPGYPVKAGEQVNLSRTQVEAAQTAMVLYAESVHDRVLRALGDSPDVQGLPPWIKSTGDLLDMLEPAGAAAT